MPAGSRRSRVTFNRLGTTQNSSGEDVTTLTALGSAWVQIVAMSGRELQAAHQTFAEARFSVMIDHPLDTYTLRRHDQIAWGSRTLDILDVEDPDQRRREQRIIAMEFTT